MPKIKKQEKKGKRTFQIVAGSHRDADGNRYHAKDSSLPSIIHTDSDLTKHNHPRSIKFIEIDEDGKRLESVGNTQQTSKEPVDGLEELTLNELHEVMKEDGVDPNGVDVTNPKAVIAAIRKHSSESEDFEDETEDKE